MAVYTNETKNSSTFTNLTQSSSSVLTFEDMTIPWNEADFPWGSPRTPWNRLSKSSTSFSNETKN